jgi:uncharacterized phiE125 gp8 family phage protein
MALVLNTAPTVEPLTVAEAKEHLRVTAGEDDAYITALIKVARRQVEGYLGRRLITQTWDLNTSEFLDVFRLPYPPLSSVTSVLYTDEDGNTGQTVTSTIWTSDTDSEPGRVFLAKDQSWPNLYGEEHALEVTVRHVAGYGATSASIPDDILHACKMWVAELYNNRGESEMKIEQNPAVRALLDMHRFLGEVDL